MAPKIRIALVDDHPLFRDGVANTLDREDDFEVVAQGQDASEAIRIARELLPDVMLIDIRMPGGGIKAVREIAATCPVTKIIMLTVSEDEDDVVDSLRAGALGYILKGISGPELLGVVRSVKEGESYLTPSLAVRVLTEMRDVPLSDSDTENSRADLSVREEQILELVAQAMSNKEIGDKLMLSEKTVKHYMTNILQKLHVRNRVEAALLAHQIAVDKKS